MRCFIAIDIPKFDDILILQEKIKKITKSTLPKSFHITLKFFANFNEKDLSSIISKLETIKFNKFHIKTSGIGFFPHNKKINVVWLGIEENNNLNALYNEIESLLSNYKNDYDFKPHITIARTEHSQNLLSLKFEKIEKKEILIDSFKLYESILTSQGPIYKIIKEFNLI